MTRNSAAKRAARAAAEATGRSYTHTRRTGAAIDETHRIRALGVRLRQMCLAECGSVTTHDLEWIVGGRATIVCQDCGGQPHDLADVIAAPQRPRCRDCRRTPHQTELIAVSAADGPVPELAQVAYRCIARAVLDDCEAGTRALTDRYYRRNNGVTGLPFWLEQTLLTELGRRARAEGFDRSVDMQRDEGFAAERGWSIRARARILADAGRSSPAGRDVVRYRAGDELTLMQYGERGRAITCEWWTNQDIDGAGIFRPGEVEVLEILEATSPYITNTPAPAP